MRTAVVLTYLMAAAQAAIASDIADAVRRQDTGEVRRLLAAKADVNEPQGDGMTALHWAAHNDDPALAALLLGAGANPEGGDAQRHAHSAAGGGDERERGRDRPAAAGGRTRRRAEFGPGDRADAGGRSWRHRVRAVPARAWCRSERDRWRPRADAADVRRGNGTSASDSAVAQERR